MKREDDEIFDDLPEDFSEEAFGENSQESEFDSDFFELDEDLFLLDDFEELERRRLAYAELKKNDKIFNNSYTLGGGEDSEDSQARSDIKVDVGSPDFQFYDKSLYSDYVDNSITDIDINEFIMQSTELRELLGISSEDSLLQVDSNQGNKTSEKKKFDKLEINKIFDLLLAGVGSGKDRSAFVSAIHILDSISSFTGMEYKKLFDMLTYDNKSTLLLELDSKYHFLDKSSKDFKIYE